MLKACELGDFIYYFLSIISLDKKKHLTDKTLAINGLRLANLY